MAKVAVLLLLVAAAAAAVARPGLEEEGEVQLDREKDRGDPELNRALDEFMDLVAQHKVVIVGKTNCEMTNRVKTAFDEHGEAPHFINIDHTRGDEALLIRRALRRWLGYWITPQVFVNGMHYGGAELLLDNHETGLLAEHLSKKEAKTEL